MPAGIRVKDNESFEGALRRFKKKCEKAGILSDLRRHQHFVGVQCAMVVVVGGFAGGGFNGGQQSHARARVRGQLNRGALIGDVADALGMGAVAVGRELE